jgi:P-type Ca2+ transporter type 2C
MVYAGTLLVQGQALAQVTATGAAQRDRPHRHGTGHGGHRALRRCSEQTAALVRNLALLALGSA